MKKKKKNSETITEMNEKKILLCNTLSKVKRKIEIQKY